MASTDGGTVRCVTCPAATTSASDPAAGSTSAAPEPSVTASSETAASKLSDANCSTRDPGPTPNRSAWLATSPARPAVRHDDALGHTR